ncbi:MAG: hypothetical protein G8345_02850 [Magnetococcales bacterium]|nr:hypothetical protein [Magnetococcales bacterium]NGZ25811.1 hypothetical protein [Magnetococcales bacterium]
MTAEVAILNRLVVALAADSSIAIEAKNGLKIYESAKKIFPLSDSPSSPANYHSVAIMVYGNANCGDVPWELVIQLFRHHVKKLGTLDKLVDYFKVFKDYVQDESGLITQEMSSTMIQRYSKEYLQKMSTEVKKSVKDLLEKNEEVTDDSITQIFCTIINNKHDRLMNDVKKIEHFTDEDMQWVCSIINNQFNNLAKGLEALLAILDRESIDKLKEILCMIHVKDEMIKSQRAGIVFAGFGKEDKFPVLIAAEVEYPVHNKVKYRVTEYVDLNIKPSPTPSGDVNEVSAKIIPFAQSRHEVHAFLHGLDLSLQEDLKGYLDGAAEGVIDKISAKLRFVHKDVIPNPDHREKITTYIDQMLHEMIEKALFNLNEMSKDKFSDRILEVVNFMPREEVAELASFLVKMAKTSNKLRGHETIRGPVDIVVITKADGLKKHTGKSGGCSCSINFNHG